MTQKIREQFEEWASARHLHIRRDGDSYFDNTMKARWITWQAAWEIALASHAPSEGQLGFVPWCKDLPNCCGGKCFESRWCCNGVQADDPTVDQHEPHCQYHHSNWKPVVLPPEIEHNDH